MKFWLINVILLKFALIAMPVTSTPVISSFREILSRRYLEMRVSMDSRDPAKIAALLAPDFESVDVDGSVIDAEHMIAELENLPPTQQKATRSTTIIDLTGSQREIKVRQRYDREIINVNAGSVRHIVHLTALSTDDWINVNDQWLLKRTATQEITIKRDGVIVTHRTALSQP
jgi:hypothetical protein